MEENKSNIMFSIKPKYIKLILNDDKIYEYRPHYWDVKYPAWFIIYESSPSCEIKYRMLLGSPYKPGDKISHDSYGTGRFNSGKMGKKFSYPILKIKRLEEPISLKILRSINVFPPQDFMYIDKKPALQMKLNIFK